VIALQIARDAPELLQSLTLLEPTLPFLIPSFPEFASALEDAAKLYFAADKVGAMRSFAAAVTGDAAPPEVIAQFRAEYLERWVEDADALFQNDMPALQRWTFAEHNLAEIKQPVLNVRGEHTLPFWHQVYLVVQKRLPHCKSLIVPGVTHAVLQMAPRVVAQHIAEFVRSQPSAEHGRAHSS